MMAHLGGAVCDVSEACRDMRSFRRALKFAKTGTGEIGKVVGRCEFDVSERGFTMLIAACRRSGRWKKAMEIFEAMSCERIRQRGVRPNFYTYSSLISVCCNAEKPGKAVKVLKAMLAAAEEDEELLPDFEVYRTVICACGRGRRHQEVLFVFGAMREMGICGDRGSWLCAINSYIENRQWRVGMDRLHELHERVGALRAMDYLGVLAVCADMENLEAAVEVFLSMQMMGTGVTGRVCHEVVRAAVAVGNVEVSLGMLGEMMENDIDAGLDTLACVLVSLKKCGLWKGVVDSMGWEGEGLDTEMDILRCICMEDGWVIGQQ